MTGPWRALDANGDFGRLWAAETVSLFGTQVTLLAVPLVAAITLGVGAFEFSLLSTLELLPLIVLALPAGVWVDRHRRRPIMIGADLARSAALASIPVAFALGVLTIGQLYVVAFASGCFTVLFDVAYQSYLPSIVEGSRLVEGNSRLEISRSAAQILGPGIAGVLITLLRAPVAIGVDALSFLGSALLLLRIRQREPSPTPGPEAAGARRLPMRREVAVGMRYVAGHPWLRALAATTGIANFFGSIGASILVLYLVRERHLAPDTIGLVLSVGALGVLLAATTTTRLTARFGVGPMLVGAAVGFSVAALPVPLAPDALAAPAAAISGFVFGVSGVAWGINQVSLRQAVTPRSMQGRMNATMRFISWGTTPLGAIIGGALGSTAGLEAAIWVGAAGGLAAFLPVALSPVRSIAVMPGPLPERDGAWA